MRAGRACRRAARVVPEGELTSLIAMEEALSAEVLEVYARIDFEKPRALEPPQQLRLAELATKGVDWPRPAAPYSSLSFVKQFRDTRTQPEWTLESGSQSRRGATPLTIDKNVDKIVANVYVGC